MLGARTPQSATHGTIDGVVTDSSLAPIAGATATILQSAVQVKTDPAGHFRMLQVPGGQYLLVIRKVRLSSGVRHRRGRREHSCFAEVFVDSIRQTASADDSSLPSPKDIAGIELYAGPS